MNRTYDAKAFSRMRERTFAFDLAARRWVSIYVWTCGAATCLLAAIAWVFDTTAICTILAGAVCLAMGVLVKPKYDARVKRRLNADLPPLDLDA